MARIRRAALPGACAVATTFGAPGRCGSTLPPAPSRASQATWITMCSTARWLPSISTLVIVGDSDGDGMPDSLGTVVVWRAGGTCQWRLRPRRRQQSGRIPRRHKPHRRSAQRRRADRQGCGRCRGIGQRGHESHQHRPRTRAGRSHRRGRPDRGLALPCSRAARRDHHQRQYPVHRQRNQ